jgi:hypothetical protein
MNTRELFKWSRKVHRLLAYPTIILVPVMIVLRMVSPDSQTVIGGPIFMIQSVLMLGLVLTCGFLFLGPKLIARQIKK